MKRINYPLLYYQLGEEMFLGILVGTDIEAMGPDLASVRKTLFTYLQKQYKKFDEFPPMDIRSPQMRLIDVRVRPAYRKGNGSFPLPDVLTLPVPAVYGEVDQGHYECHLPHFRESFHYYTPRQFEMLVRYAATNLLNQISPERIYRMMHYPEPMLDLVTLKVNDEREYYWGGFDYQRRYETLERLAERYPPTKSERRQISALPDAAWEREAEVSAAVDKIINTRSNLLIVGRPGTGKSAVLSQAIKQIATRSRKEMLGYTFWRIQPQRITASTKYLGEWQEVVEQMVEELSVSNGIIWFEQLVQLLQTGGDGPEDSVGAYLTNFLRQGKLQIVGEVTQQELESIRRLLPGFAEAFQVIQLEPLSHSQTLNILQRFAEYSSQQLRIDIPKDAQQLSYSLLQRYLPHESFPGKAVRFLGQCINRVRYRNLDEAGTSVVLETFIEQTGLPELFLRDELQLNPKEVAGYFRKRIIGQPAVVETLSRIVTIYKAGLNNPNRPIASLLFAGPTGVGKTASAKALSAYFFGKGKQKQPLIPIDMSEFQYPEQIARLIGAGREPGTLVKEVRERPFSVLLLDEIEKASPVIFDLLLRLLDEGVMVDAYGRETSFRNTIIIMTSNLGASNRSAVGFGSGANGDQGYRSAIERHFRPEFVNRIDELVVFNPLGSEDIRQICQMELSGLEKREGFRKRGIRLSFSEAVLQRLAKVGFDERYGARPLQRAIEDHVVTPAARFMLKNKIEEPGKLLADTAEGKPIQFTFQAKTTQQ